jgi:hypothetical protein
MAAVLERFRTAEFQGNPVRVFDDSNNVNPPCVWVPMPEVAFSFHKGTMEVTWTAFLVVPASSTVSISEALSGLTDAITGLFPYTDGRPQPLRLREGAQPVPAYQLTWQSRIKIGA